MAQLCIFSHSYWHPWCEKHDLKSLPLSWNLRGMRVSYAKASCSSQGFLGILSFSCTTGKFHLPLLALFLNLSLIPDTESQVRKHVEVASLVDLGCIFMWNRDIFPKKQWQKEHSSNFCSLLMISLYPWLNQPFIPLESKLFVIESVPKISTASHPPSTPIACFGKHFFSWCSTMMNGRETPRQPSWREGGTDQNLPGMWEWGSRTQRKAKKYLR